MKRRKVRVFVVAEHILGHQGIRWARDKLILEWEVARPSPDRMRVRQNKGKQRKDVPMG